VRYLAGWHGYVGEIVGPCSRSIRKKVEVPPASEFPLEFAIPIRLEPGYLGTVAGEVMGQRTIRRERNTVDAERAPGSKG